MKLAYFTPLNPKRSGISDYNEELLPFLANKGLQIDIYIDKGYEPSNKLIRQQFNCISYDRFTAHNVAEPYDLCIYHMGNNTTYHEYIYEQLLKFPGIVVLHDYALHHFLAMRTFGRKKFEEYIAEMEYNYGTEGAKLAKGTIEGKIGPLWEADSLKYPANKRVLDNALGVIVHSDFVRNKIRAAGYQGLLQNVPLHCSDIEYISEERKKEAKRKLGISEDLLIMASFGFISSAKRIDVILGALAKYKHINSNFKYFLVGESLPGHDYKQAVKELGLDKHVIFTDFIDLDTFKQYMIATDICFNLRYPTQGETSASLVRVLGMGKCTLVSKVGSFSDIPDDSIIKIEVGPREEEEILGELIKLHEDKKLVLEIGQRAYDYIANFCTLENSASLYYQFCRQVLGVKGIDYTLQKMAKVLRETGQENNSRIKNIISRTIVDLGLCKF